MDDDVRVREFLRTGEEAHFQALVERHRGRVFRLVLSLLGPGHAGAAEELTQDVFLKVYRTLHGFRGDAKFSTWLYRIAYNEAIRHRALARFRASHDSDEALTTMPARGRGDDPFTVSADARTTASVKECLAQLPDLYRSVLHLHYWLGLTVPEISAMLLAPEGTVKSYLHRARARLHQLLARKGITDV